MMRMVLVAGLAGVGVAKAEGDAAKAGAGAAKPEFVYIVETTDLQKKVTREIKSVPELAEIKKTIDAEAHVFPKALALAKKDWAAANNKGAQSGNKTNAPAAAQSQAFPAGMSPRKLEISSFSDREKAQKQKDKSDKLDKDIQDKADKLKQAQLAKQAKGQNAATSQDQKAALEKAKADTLALAATMVQARIDELLKNELGGSPVAAAPAATAK